MAHVVEEALEDLGPPRGVGDLGVELDSVEAALAILHRGDRGPGWSLATATNPSGAIVTWS